MKNKIVAGSAFGVLLVAGVLALVFSAWQPAQAQAGSVAWYRVVNQGRSAGTMNEWRRVGSGYAGTFPFLEGFELNIRPDGDRIGATVSDGPVRVSTEISCTSDRAPRRGMLRATRAGADQRVIVVAMQCSATQPSP